MQSIQLLCSCKQAEQILGMTADELAALKEGSGLEAYEAVLKKAQWKEWQFRVQSKSQWVLSHHNTSSDMQGTNQQMQEMTCMVRRPSEATAVALAA